MTIQLIGVQGPLAGRRFPLGDQPLTFGRSADNQVVIVSARASRHHAQMRLEGGVAVVYDLGSANGTLVNGQRVQRAALRPGDLLEIGDESFRLDAASAQDATLMGAPGPTYSQGPSQVAPIPQSYQQPPLGYQQPPQSYQQPPQGYQPQYAPPPASAPVSAPPQKQSGSGGRTCLLSIVILLALVCVAGVAGAALLRDRLGEIAGGLPFDIPGGLAPTTAPGSFPASATIGSGQSGGVSMPNGAMIQVPPGAVPPKPDGSPGSLEFAIRPAVEQPVNLPEGLALSGPLYQLEPDGITFAAPVKITLPIPADTDPALVMGLVTRDPATSEWTAVRGVVDAEARTISAEVTHFSPYGIYTYGSGDPEAWNRANGGWFVVENRTLYGESSFPGCRNLPRALYVNVCISGYVLDDPSLESFYVSPANNLLALGPRRDAGVPYRSLKGWLPAGAYTVVHYIFMSEVNPGSIDYSPCVGWWALPARTITLGPGDSVTFEPFAPGGANVTRYASFNTATCTGEGAAGEPTPVPEATAVPEATPVSAHGACPATLNGDWDMVATLRSATDPEMQDEIGDVEEATFGFEIDGAQARVQLVEGGERSDFAEGTCTARGDRYIIEVRPPVEAAIDDDSAIIFDVRFNGANRLTGELILKGDGEQANADMEMTRR